MRQLLGSILVGLVVMATAHGAWAEETNISFDPQFTTQAVIPGGNLFARINGTGERPGKLSLYLGARDLMVLDISTIQGADKFLTAVVPLDTEPGEYVLRAEVIVGNKFGAAETMIKVVSIGGFDEQRLREIVAEMTQGFATQVDLQILRDQLTNAMNGLGNRIAAVEAGVADLGAKIAALDAKLTAMISQVKAELYAYIDSKVTELRVLIATLKLAIDTHIALPFNRAHPTPGEVTPPLNTPASKR